MKRLLLSLTLLGLGWARSAEAGEARAFEVRQRDDRLEIRCDGQAVADYVFRDLRILRPYFANLCAPGGQGVTRNHPPVAGADATDHDTMHPGLWLAFGDINGDDFWRNKGRIEHVRFLEPPQVKEGQVSFATENHLTSAQGRRIGRQVSHVVLSAMPHGFLLVWQADFLPGDEPLVFGDQEEMGLGVRVATAITEKNGGMIVSSTGIRTAAATWGQSYAWCDYSGERDGRRVGVTLMPDPANFRPSWFHNRDYGLMVANPFGRKAMNQGGASRVVVAKSERFRLRFGAYLHASPAATPADPDSAHRRFLGMKAAEVRD